MAKLKCSYCGHENIVGSDHCGKCLHSFTQKDQPQPSKDKFQKKLMTEHVVDFISKIPPIIVSPSTPISAVLDEMHKFPTKGCVLVCDSNKKLLGIVSIRDILLKVAGVIADPSKVTVSTIMTANPESLDKDARLSFALHKMFIGKFRHVPVLDHGVAVGVVSTRDIIEYLTTKKK